MQLFSGPPVTPDVRSEDFAGRWYLCDDGWLGTLTLALTAPGTNELSGTFASERFEEEFRVTGRAGTTHPHAVEFTIHDFNWLPEQCYQGLLLTRTQRTIAGHSMWKDAPFGFFATRGTRPSLGSYRAGAVRGEDFAGGWTAYLDGELATITLEYERDSGLLRGTCTGELGTYRVSGRPDESVPHRVSLGLFADDGPAVADLSGYLMSRPKNAVSGTMSVAGLDLGLVMIRYA